VLKEINYKILLLLIATSLLFGIIFNALSKNGLDLIRTETELNYANIENPTDYLKQNADEVNIESKEPALIKLEEAYNLYSSGKVIFIDARDQWDFNDGHIKGALNIPEYKYDIEMPIVKALNKNFSFVIYCGDIECDVSKRLAIELSKIGFKNILILEGGWTKWIELNYPIEKK
jgi:rhodanese-related sulfurtransferase